MKKVKFWLWVTPSFPFMILAGLSGLAIGYVAGYAMWLAEGFGGAFMEGYREGHEQTEYPHETSPRRSGGLF